MALMDFDDWLALQDKYATPHMAIGLSMYFASETMHVWPGSRPVVAPDRIFLAAGDVGTISGLEIGYGRPSETIKIELSGLSLEYFAFAENQAAEVKGRKAEIFLLAFGTGVKGEEWKLAAVSLEATREMDRLTRHIDYDAGTSTITLTMEPVGSMRWRAAAGLLTDDDQRARHPTDRALERTGLVQYSRPMVF